jgi:hypothetical protein
MNFPKKPKNIITRKAVKVAFSAAIRRSGRVSGAVIVRNTGIRLNGLMMVRNEVNVYKK